MGPSDGPGSDPVPEAPVGESSPDVEAGSVPAPDVEDGSDGMAVACSSCGEAAPADATWCEACGHELATEPKPACVSCGEREVDPDEGYCLSCGYRQPRERDHLVVVDGPVVAVSDRGRRHHDNEDAVAIGRVADPADPDRPDTIVLVVCDGVSSTAGSAAASALAAEAARDALMAGLAEGPTGPAAETGAEVGPDDDWMVGLVDTAVAAAQREASTAAGPGAPEPADDTDAATAGRSPDPSPADPAAREAATSLGFSANGDDGPPSSTLVAVVARPAADGATELVTAWVGDSRAYWLGSADRSDARRLTTVDHELEGGLVRWLGADSVDPSPDVEIVRVSGPGHLVVCSDGLWRYAAEAGELAALVHRYVDDGRHGLDLAQALVGHANEQGGHDNITVALWAAEPGGPPEPRP